MRRGRDPQVVLADRQTILYAMIVNPGVGIYDIAYWQRHSDKQVQ